MKKILTFIILFCSVFSIKSVFGYNDYNSCSSYYNHKNDSFCYNKYNGNNTDSYYDYNSCCSYYNNGNNTFCSNKYNTNYNNRTINNAFDDYDSCRSYYSNGNNSFCYNYYYGNSSGPSSYYDYNSCRIYYNYSNDSYCISKYNNVYYSNSSNPSSNVNFYDYNSCRKYYNYNNDSLCNSYYFGISNTFYTDYNSCSKYFKNNNNNYCTNKYKDNYNYNNYNNYYNSSNYINSTRTGEENYWNMIYTNGLDNQYSNTPPTDFFTKNVISTSIGLDKFDDTQMIDFHLSNQSNIDKYNASKKFVDALRQEIRSRYINGQISNDKMNDISNDFSYYIYYLNLYFENLRNVEKGKNISQNQKDSIYNLKKTKTFFEKLKATLKSI